MELPILNNRPQPGQLADGLACLGQSLVPLANRKPLPMTAAEMAERGWEEVDVVFVTGDAYIDHPSFAMPSSAAC